MLPRRERKSLLVEVQVRDQAELYMHRARNLNDGGLFVDAPLPLPIGTELEINFRLPGNMPIYAQGKVIWATTPADEVTGMGVAFTWVSDECRAAIVGWMSAG